MIGYVINLDRSPGRWAFMAAMGKSRGLPLRRVPAVDGRTLAPERLGALCPSGGTVRPLAPTEIACFESHKAAWAAIADGRDTHGVVLEDDVYLDEGFAGRVRAIAAAHPELDLVKLNATRRRIWLHAAAAGTVDGIRLHRPAQRTVDASAYLISRACARAALAAFATFGEELDVLLFDPRSGRRVAHALPALCVQEKFSPFRFLDGSAADSQIEVGRAAMRVRARAGRPPRALRARLAAEAARVWRRRILPGAVAVANLARRPEDRLLFTAVPLAAPEGRADAPGGLHPPAARL